MRPIEAKCGGSWEYGSWFIRLPFGILLLKAPWNEPLFSERYGHVRVLARVCGWRLIARSNPSR